MTKHKSSYKKIIISVTILSLVLGAALVLRSSRDNENQVKTQGQSTVSTNLNPPTETEINETEQRKQEISEKNAPTNLQTGSDGRKQVKPVITSADKSNVTAYITGIFEENGTCTATLTNGPQSITKSSTGFQNASYTQCAPIDLSTTLLGNGTWSVTVSYSSNTASGTSDASIIRP